MQKLWRKATYWIASRELLSLLSCTTQRHLPRRGTTNSELGPPISLIKKMPDRLTIGQPYIEAFSSTESLSSQITVAVSSTWWKPIQDYSLSPNPVHLGIYPISHRASYFLTMILFPTSVSYLAPFHMNVHVWVLNLWRTLFSIKYSSSSTWFVNYILWLQPLIYNFSQVPFCQWDVWLWRNSIVSLSVSVS